MIDKLPQNIGVSLSLYENLEDSHKYAIKNNNEVKMWMDGRVE